MLFAVFTLPLPSVLVALVTTGIGGGAIGVPVAGIAGGYALAGLRLWLRVITGVFAVLMLAGLIATVRSSPGSRLRPRMGRGSPRSSAHS